ncbi:MAG: tetratricopeptide repeat protein, partial [Candidatus Cloacimonetes bacterium]|nr:tetratricopeptide repeat protein [Candidatus Cloacimonadota bacterium]
SYYGRTPTKILQETLIYFSWLFPVLAGLILCRFRSKLRSYLPELLIFVIGFLPVSGLVTFEGQNWNTAADRYLYLSFLGIAWLISVLADSIRKRRYVYLLVFIILIWTGITAFNQVRIWENNETIWTRAIEITHNDEIPYNRRGVTYYHQGNYSKALADLTNALEINPDHYQSLYARGLVYQKMQQPKLAISDYSSALRLQPTDPDPDLIYNRALMLISTGSYQLAIADLSRVIEMNPEDKMAYYNRAAVYFYLGYYRNAWDDLTITEKLGGYVNPDFKMDVINALEQGKQQ